MGYIKSGQVGQRIEEKVLDDVPLTFEGLAGGGSETNK
jgi:hypothetical protein